MSRWCYKLVKDKGVTGLTDVMTTLPDLANVNGLMREEFSAAALGFVKASGFSTCRQS